MSALTPGRLLLVPTPLDFGCTEHTPIGDVLPAGTLAAAASTAHWITENAKTTRAFLKRVGEHTPLRVPLQQQTLTELPRELHKKGDHGSAIDTRPMLQAALDGADMGLVSEAGMPAVADPGSSVVRAAHELGLQVVPLVGPVSILLALAASGLNGQNFAFVGYLPQDAADRTQRIRQLEALSLQTGQTQMWIETPYRNAAMMDALLQTLQSGTRLAVASGLTLGSAQVRSQRVSQWKLDQNQRPAAVPAVFAIGP